MQGRNDNKNADRDIPDAPEMEQTDWDSIASGTVSAEVVPDDGDIRYPEADTAESPEEDDDNPYQESDEALPDDGEEEAIDSILRRQETR